MNKYHYNGRIITASSKQMAIKKIVHQIRAGIDDYGNECDKYGDPIQKLDESKLSNLGKAAVKKLKEVIQFLKSNIDGEYYKLVAGLKHDTVDNDKISYNYSKADDEGWLEDAAEAGVSIYNKIIDHDVEIIVVAEEDDYSKNDNITMGIYLKGKDLDGEYYDYEPVDNLNRIFKLMPFLKNFKQYVLRYVYNKSKDETKITYKKFVNVCEEDVMDSLERGDKLDSIADYIGSDIDNILEYYEEGKERIKKEKAKETQEQRENRLEDLLVGKKFSDILKDKEMIKLLPETLIGSDWESFLKYLPKEILELKYKQLKHRINTDTLAIYIASWIDNPKLLPKYAFDITDKNGVSVPYAMLNGANEEEFIIDVVKNSPKKAMLIKNNKGISAKDLALKSLKNFSEKYYKKEKQELETLLEAL